VTAITTTCLFGQALRVELCYKIKSAWLADFNKKRATGKIKPLRAA
jgi:hypothetical protein